MSRVLRRLQDVNSPARNTGELCDSEDKKPTCDNGARRKKFPTNPFDILIEDSHSESEEPKSEDDAQQNAQEECSRRKKKRKRKKSIKETIVKETIKQDNCTTEVVEVHSKNENEHEPRNKKCSCPSNTGKGGKYVELSIQLRNLNVNTELKKMFGSKVIENENRYRNRNRVQIKRLWLVNVKEHWPTLEKTGLSMRCERTSGTCNFFYVHDADYQKIQRRFLRAVNTFNQENIADIVYSHPYHVDALIQLSDLYKLTEDLQTAADLNERALYSLESAFHPIFSMSQGALRVDYRRQENRALFICLFKHILFVGQRACYQTALELSKLLLSFDFNLDPLAVILCIDFYALRSGNYSWLIEVSKKWEKDKNISLLPNFAFSNALAHFFSTEANGSQDYATADQLLQDALISFPGVLNLLLEKCSVQMADTIVKHHFFHSDVELTQTPALTQLITLYVHRTYCEWKRPNVIQWLETNVRTVLNRVESGEKFVKDCLLVRLRNYNSTPRNVLRHILLTDIKEVTATIATSVSSSILSFDPLPPIDSIDLYSYAEFSKYNEESRSLTSLLLTSYLPNLDTNERHNDQSVGESLETSGLLQVPVEDDGVNHRDVTRDGVIMLMDAIGAIVASIPLRQDDRNESNANQNEIPIVPQQNEDSVDE